MRPWTHNASQLADCGSLQDTLCLPHGLAPFKPLIYHCEQNEAWNCDGTRLARLAVVMEFNCVNGGTGGLTLGKIWTPFRLAGCCHRSTPKNLAKECRGSGPVAGPDPFDAAGDALVGQSLGNEWPQLRDEALAQRRPDAAVGQGQRGARRSSCVWGQWRLPLGSQRGKRMSCESPPSWQALWTRWSLGWRASKSEPRCCVHGWCLFRRHKAVVEYLESFGDTFADSASALRREAGIGGANCKGEGARANLLARKWTVIARLQKQVTELEARIAEGGAGGAGLARPTRKDFLPMRTPQHTLTGHRGAVLVSLAIYFRSGTSGHSS